MGFTDAMFNRAPVTRVQGDSKADVAAWAKELRQKKYRGELSSEMKSFGENVDNMTNEQLSAMLADLMVKRDELMVKAKEARENQARRDERKANFKDKLMGLGQKFTNSANLDVQQDAPWLNKQQAQPVQQAQPYNSAPTNNYHENSHSLFNPVITPKVMSRGTYDR